MSDAGREAVRTTRRLRDRLAGTGPGLLALGALGAIAIGGLLHLLDLPAAGDAVWAALVAAMLLSLGWSVLANLVRGNVGVDSIALLAMVGALASGEYLAGAVIALMLSGGNALEAAAGRRARRELTLLVERAPKIAHRRRGGALEEVPVAELEIGDLVVVRAGEVVPVDGVVSSEEAVLDESALTGEPLPVTYERARAVRSGTANAGAAFEMRTTRPASESAYAALVRVVEAAEGQRAPFLRLADRYAGFFLPVDDRGRRPRLGAERRPGARTRRGSRSDPVPADPRRADRARLRDLAGGAGGRSSSRGAGRSSDWATPARSRSTRPGR